MGEAGAFACPRCGRIEMGRWPQSCLEAVHLSEQGDDGLGELRARLETTPTPSSPTPDPPPPDRTTQEHPD